MLKYFLMNFAIKQWHLLNKQKNEKKPTAMFSDSMSCFRWYKFHIAHLHVSGEICSDSFTKIYPCSLYNCKSTSLITVILKHVSHVNPTYWYPKYELNLSMSPWGLYITLKHPLRLVFGSTCSLETANC